MQTTRRVVDSNSLRSSRLETYLAARRTNIAVLTEFVLVEAYKCNPLITFPASLAILERFSQQVVVLKPSEKQLGMRGRASGMQRRLIDKRMTTEFPRLCARIRQAAAGDAEQTRFILDTARIASIHMDKLVEAAPSIIQLFEFHAQRFTPMELNEIARQQPYSGTTQAKLIDMIMETTADIARATGAISPRTPPREITNLPVFRYCLCMALLFTRWVAGGRQKGTRPARTANDVMDANVAAYATYFDGVLSEDEKLLSVHTEARHILREIGVAVGK